MTNSIGVVYCSCGHPNYKHSSRDNYSTNRIGSCSSCTCAVFNPSVKITEMRTSNIQISQEDFTEIIRLLGQAYNTICLNKDILDRFDLQRWMDKAWDVLGKYKETH